MSRTSYSLILKPPGFFFQGGHSDSDEEPLTAEETLYSEEEFSNAFGGEPDDVEEEVNFEGVFGELPEKEALSDVLDSLFYDGGEVVEHRDIEGVNFDLVHHFMTY